MDPLRHSPYPGLRPFGQDDSEYFFGRERQISALLDRLSERSFIAVIGASGSGKSSLVRAGLLPMLEVSETPWTTWVVRPESAPFEALARSMESSFVEASSSSDAPMHRSRLIAMLNDSSNGLVEAVRELGARTDGGRRYLLIVDQFEELIRYDQESIDTSLNFVRLLLATVRQTDVPVQVMITLRLDFLGDCTRYPGLTEAINDGQYLVPALDRFQRAEAIQRPAELAGKPIAWDLQQTLLNAADDAQDQLPVLQHCLMRLWQVAGDEPGITMAHYEMIGSLDQALSTHADQLFEALSIEQQELASHLFKAITDIDKSGRGMRRPRSVDQLVECLNLQATQQDNVPEVLRSVVDHFRDESACFLMPSRRTPLAPYSIIDITHESLIRQWPRISGYRRFEGWLQEEEADGRRFVRIVYDALNWHESQRSSSYAVLQNLQGWWGTGGHTASWGMRYIQGALRKELYSAVGLADKKINGDVKVEREERKAHLAIIDRFIDDFLVAGTRKLRRLRALRLVFLGVTVANLLVLVGSGLWWGFEYLKNTARSEALEAKQMELEAKQGELDRLEIKLKRTEEALQKRLIELQ